MNNSVKIILAVVTFVACAALGYLVIPSEKSKSDTEQTGGGGTDGGNNTPGGTSGFNGGGGQNGGEQVPNEGNDENSDKTTTDGDDSVDEPKTDSVEIVNNPKEPEQVDPLPEPVQSVETTPEIKSVSVGQRSSTDVKLGMSLTVNATVASGDKLRYELYEIGETTAKYTSNNGRFKEVYPVDGGKYLLKVVNTKTGDFAERQVSGFNKIDKYTSAKLQEQLNLETIERLFYFHFDEEKLKFGCEGIDSSEVPTSLNALLSSRVANGWVLTVVGTPQYDKYNRITYFKVRITE